MKIFIEKARRVHQNKYTYPAQNYVNNKTKITIICPIHGEFLQRPDNHLTGKGCGKCCAEKSSKRQSTGKAGFLEQAMAVHGTKYDYEKVDYKNNKTKVLIICPVHGEFKQTPWNHYRFDCKKCSRDIVSSGQKGNTAEFVEKAIKRHGNKYVYTEVKYAKRHEKVKITCKLHGAFFQTPNSHLRGSGCPACKQGELNPRFGKSPAHSQGYCGQYKGTVFRSLPELFWMLEAENQGIPYLGLDEPGTRQKWQVPVFYDGRKHTYCADFYLPATNEIIDVKPAWKETVEISKLTQGKLAYEKRGYQFKLVYTESITLKPKLLRKLVDDGSVHFNPPSLVRFNKRFGKVKS